MIDFMLLPISKFRGLWFATSLSVLAAACGPADNDPGPGGVTVGEAKALDEAAEMIEQRRLPDGALPPDAGKQAPLPPDEVEAKEAAPQQ